MRRIAGACAHSLGYPGKIQVTLGAGNDEGVLSLCVRGWCKYIHVREDLTAGGNHRTEKLSGCQRVYEVHDVGAVVAQQLVKQPIEFDCREVKRYGYIAEGVTIDQIVRGLLDALAFALDHIRYSVAGVTIETADGGISRQIHRLEGRLGHDGIDLYHIDFATGIGELHIAGKNVTAAADEQASR